MPLSDETREAGRRKGLQTRRENQLERQSGLLAYILENEKFREKCNAQYIFMNTNYRQYNSITTLRKDLKAIEPELEKEGIHIKSLSQIRADAKKAEEAERLERERERERAEQRQRGRWAFGWK